jgi:hypothetical protein
MITGKILDKIGYVRLSKSIVSDSKGTNCEVYTVHPYNPGSKTAGNTARRYMERDNDAKDMIVDNTPFTLTLLNTQRYQMAEAVFLAKDIDDNCFSVSLQQVTEAIALNGISPGGLIPGTFVWATVNRNLEPIVVGGRTYVELQRLQEERDRQNEMRMIGLAPSETNLQVGHVYETNSGEFALFLGNVVHSNNTNYKYYAFIAMPNKPHPMRFGNGRDYTLEETREYVQQVNRYYDKQTRELYVENSMLMQQTYFNWDNLSWVERCKVLWDDRSALYAKLYGEKCVNYVVPTPIKLLSSASSIKSDTGDVVSEEFMNEIRRNDECLRKYVNGNDIDMSEKLYESQTGKKHVVSYGMTVEAQDDVSRQIKQTREEFRDNLKWQ